ncbi:MAG: cysteine synthase A [Candidatus Bipolaricaulota bacterium]
MNSIAENVTELIGSPIVRLNEMAEEAGARVLAKLESANPGGSIKDRIAVNMVDQAEKRGLVDEGTTIVEPTSGNTGVGLAMVCAARGYELILVMPDSATQERRDLFRAYGVELELTPGEDGMKGAIQKAEDIAGSGSNYYLPLQFENPANPDIHRKTTAEEIWEDTGGDVDVFVAGVGTGGTITGVSERLKEKNPELTSVAVEPAESPVLSGGESGDHEIPGIGAGFIPEVLNQNIIDEVFRVKSSEAKMTTRALAVREGILAGPSSGAAAKAALEVGSRRENKDKTVVVILPDTGERYLSTGVFVKGSDG